MLYNSLYEVWKLKKVGFMGGKRFFHNMKVCVQRQFGIDDRNHST